MFEDFGNRNAHSTNQRFVRWVYFALQDLATDYTDNRDEWEKIDFKILAQLLYMGKIYD